MLEKYINEKKDEIVQNLQKLIQIPSVYENSTEPSMPFGKNINYSLEYMLDLGKKLGFRTKNVDGYCGYIEFGEGDELVGIIGHLDVVPAGEDWNFPPFNATIFDNKIYGRGAIDDKGPVIASLYAMKAVLDTCKIRKRVRLILGLNEENSWKCIDYYKQHEELPTISFSPDADFPCIYAEKSILTTCLSQQCNISDDIIITDMDCNNNPTNVVPKICKTILKVNIDKINIHEFINNLKNIIDKYSFDIEIYKLSFQEIKLTSYGVGAHSAHPDLGINAISRLLIVLDEIFKTYNISFPLLNFFNTYINTQYDGKNLGINYKDESGALTLNVGKIIFENNQLALEINLRIPIHTKIETIENTFKKLLENYSNINYKRIASKDSLYVSKDSYLVKTLCDVFNKLNNSSFEPIAIGGATYARAFENCISFGANMPGAKDMCHQTDEFISIDNLLFATKVYANAIYELSK